MKIEFYGETNVGSVRKENQDAYAILDKEQYFVVCDGMGGSAAGDFASKVAVEVVSNLYKHLTFDMVKDKILFSDEDKEFVEAMNCAYVPIVSHWIANRILYNYQEKYPLLSGMGTTIVSMLLDKKYNIAHIFHVGDSRVYRLRNNKLELLTKDHSKIEELLSQGKITEKDIASSELKSMVVRVLGPKRDVEIDYQIETVQEGDIFLLCSDGLNGEIDDGTIEQIIKKNSANVSEICAELIYAANRHGGGDNITVEAIKIISLEEEQFPDQWNNIIGKTFTAIANEQKYSSQLNDLVKKISKEIKTPVSEKAKEKGIFKNPVVLVIIFLLLLFGTFIVLNYYKAKSYDMKKAQQQKRLVSGIIINIRTPNDVEIEKYNSTSSEIDRQWLVKDWYERIDDLTNYVSEVEFSLISLIDNKIVYSGVVTNGILEIPLDAGKYTYSFSDRYLVFSTEFSENQNQIEIIPAEKFQTKTIIIVPKY